jgi:hypothetical protein
LPAEGGGGSLTAWLRLHLGHEEEEYFTLIDEQAS